MASNDARDAACAHPAQEGQPGVVALRVHDAQAQHAPPAVLVAAYGRDHGRGGDAPVAPALDVGGVDPEAGRAGGAKRPLDELLDLGVEVLADGADPALREPLYAHRGGDPLHLSRAGASGAHLGDGGHDGPVHPLVALDHVVREEAAGAELRDPERQRPHAGI